MVKENDARSPSDRPTGPRRRRGQRVLAVRLNGSDAQVLGQAVLLVRDERGATDAPSKRTLKKERRRVLNLLRAQLAQATGRYFNALCLTDKAEAPEVHGTHVVGLVQTVLKRESEALRAPASGADGDGATCRRKSLADLILKTRLHEDAPLSRHASPSNRAPQDETSPRTRTVAESLDVQDAPLPTHIVKVPPTLEREPSGDLSARASRALRDFHPEVVLYAPQIPQNTGTVARLCAAMSARLHLIEPLGFDVSARAVRRAGLDYWEQVDVTVHKDFDHLLRARPARRLVFVETGGEEPPETFAFAPGDLLVFGAETTGVPPGLIAHHRAASDAALLTIPMYNRGVRSINLANTVSIALYLAVARLNAHRGAAP